MNVSYRTAESVCKGQTIPYAQLVKTVATK